MSLILGVDTSERANYLAVSSEEKTICRTIRAEEGSFVRTTEVLLSEMASLLSEADVSLDQLTHIAVALGPGSFTGIRGGIAAAQGLARGLDIPIVGVSTLFARALPRLGTASILVPTLKASATEEFFSVFHHTNFETEVSPEIVEIAEQSAAPGAEIEARVGELVGSARSEISIFSVDSLGGDNAEQNPAGLICSAAPLLTEENKNLTVSFAVQRVETREGEAAVLQPLYGRGVNAKTLAERGISVRS